MPRTPLVAQIDANRCTGCGRCIAACHLPIIAFETTAWRKTAVLQDAPRCTGCGRCEPRCPVGAISLRTPPNEWHSASFQGTPCPIPPFSG